MTFGALMDRNHPEALDFKELADYKWFKVVNFQWTRQDHYRIDGADGVTIIPQRKDGKFVMIRQRRPMFHDAHLEFVNGSVDEGESAEESAKREVLEESGYVVERIDFITKASMSPSQTINASTLFWAEVDNQPLQSPTDLDVPGAEVVVLDKLELLAAMRSGEVHQSTTSALLYALFLRRDPMLKQLADLD